VPFSELDGTIPARIVLEQIGPKTFRLVESEPPPATSAVRTVPEG
jgi:hypothetical protein